MKAAGQIRYFDELTERIRDIRSSERIFYLKVKDIFRLSIDYDAKTTQAKQFFATIQNKLHWARIFYIFSFLNSFRLTVMPQTRQERRLLKSNHFVFIIDG